MESEGEAIEGDGVDKGEFSVFRGPVAEPMICGLQRASGRKNDGLLRGVRERNMS